MKPRRLYIAAQAAAVIGLLAVAFLPWRVDPLSGDQPHVSAADHPLLLLVALLLLMWASLGTLKSRAHGVVPAVLATLWAGFLLFAAGTVTFCWDGRDATGRAVGGCVSLRPGAGLWGLLLASLVVLMVSLAPRRDPVRPGKHARTDARRR